MGSCELVWLMILASIVVILLKKNNIPLGHCSWRVLIVVNCKTVITRNNRERLILFISQKPASSIITVLSSIHRHLNSGLKIMPQLDCMDVGKLPGASC